MENDIFCLLLGFFLLLLKNIFSFIYWLYFVFWEFSVPIFGSVLEILVSFLLRVLFKLLMFVIQLFPFSPWWFCHADKDEQTVSPSPAHQTSPPRTWGCNDSRLVLVEDVCPPIPTTPTAHPCKSKTFTGVAYSLPAKCTSTPLWSIMVALTLLLTTWKPVTLSMAGCFFPWYS